MRPTLQKYLNMRNPPRGSTAQVAMPTAAMTGASFPLRPTNTTPAPQPQGYTPPVIGGLVMPWRTIFFAIIIFSVAGLFMRAILDGDVRLFQRSTASIVAAPVFVVVTATPQPTPQPTAPAPVVIIVTMTPPPVYAQPVAPPQPAQRSGRSALPSPVPTQAAAWPAPLTAMGYQCPDGRFFPSDGPWGWGPFGVWVSNGNGDVIDIRDTLEQSSTMGWHYKCQRTWR